MANELPPSRWWQDTDKIRAEEKRLESRCDQLVDLAEKAERIATALRSQKPEAGDDVRLHAISQDIEQTLERCNTISMNEQREPNPRPVMAINALNRIGHEVNLLVIRCLSGLDEHIDGMPEGDTSAAYKNLVQHMRQELKNILVPAGMSREAE